MTKPIMNEDKIITLKRFHHRGQWCIGFHYAYSKELYQQLMSLRSSLYTQTHGCVYIPYNTEAYQEFKRLNLPYEVIAPQDNISRTRQSPLESDISAITHSDPMKEGGKLDTDIDIESNQVDSIIWQDNHFHIHLQYAKEEVEYLKTLRGCYWQGQQKMWICKGSLKNLQSLQARYTYWDDPTYRRLEEHATAYSNLPRITLKAVANDLTRLEVVVRNGPDAVKWIKAMPDRSYLSDSKSWLIPRDHERVDELIAQCQAKEYQVTVQYTKSTIEPNTRTRDKTKWVKAILSKVSAEQLTLMRDYAHLFVRKNYSYQTMKAYCASFQRYVNSLSDITKINDQSMSDIEAYLNAIALKKVSHQEINRHISALKYYYEHLGGWSKMRLDLVNRPKSPKTLPYIFSIGEVQNLLSQVTNVKHKCLLLLTYGCGLRSGEVVTLRVTDIMTDRGQIFIRGAKGKKDRVVMLPKNLLPILHIYMSKYRPDGWLFPGQKRSSPYSSSSLRRIFKTAIKKAGLDSRYKLHSLRHSFATHLMESGTQQRLIQKLLGHSSPKTTEIYTHISKGSITEIKSPLDYMNVK